MVVLLEIAVHCVVHRDDANRHGVNDLAVREYTADLARLGGGVDLRDRRRAYRGRLRWTIRGRLRDARAVAIVVEALAGAS